MKSNEESTWHRTSSSLDASVKIYGYRVDSVHTDLFKFLGGLNRANLGNEREEENKIENDKKKKKGNNAETYNVSITKLKLSLAKSILRTILIR